jgi:2-phospho-L-lactate guanylyltransferase (CobY/MobA/RfbA family)
VADRTECHTLLSSIQSKESRRNIVSNILKDVDVRDARKYTLVETLTVLEKSARSVSVPSILAIYYAIKNNQDGTARIWMKRILENRVSILQE